ncbi:MAG: DinB family protein [Anaerolineae bacterium]|jgi:FMN phosphatase YigB (HAD superfamily)|nr:DinB family protein [Anaerolineae bacterium]
MIKAVLLDLDDTLLRNPNQGFVPEYLRLIDEFFGKPISQYLLKAVGSARDSSDIPTPIFDRILQVIRELSGETDLDEKLAQFYQERYPLLEKCTRPVVGAAELVQTLLQRGYSTVIATNPLYPAIAIQERLRWAGLPHDLEAYAFVSHANNMHFTKPHAAYYAEILGRVGVEPDETIMIGDSLENDITPAALLGIHTFQITPGELQPFIDYLDHLETLLPVPLQPEMILPQLRGNLGALFGLIANVKPHFWTQHPDPDEWSPLEIICHLLERETSVHRVRLERILQEQNPFIVDPGLPLGPNQAPLCAQDGLTAARDFLTQREITITRLEALSAQDWQRPARHSIFGPTTLLEMVHFTAQHDRLHLKQLCRTIGKCE